MALNIKTIYSRNIWILMLYSAFHMLGVNVNYLGNVKCFNLCLKLCSICTLCAKCGVLSLKEAIVINK